MRPMLTGCAVAVALLLVPADLDATPTAALRTGRINVTATLVHIASRAVGARGRQSNASEQSWRITDRYGHHIGHWYMQCRWIVPRARLCYGEIQLPLGKLTVSGSSDTAFEGEFVVTGGTRRYRGAGGNMLFTAIGLRKSVLLITVTT